MTKYFLVGSLQDWHCTVNKTRNRWGCHYLSEPLTCSHAFKLHTNNKKVKTSGTLTFKIIKFNHLFQSSHRRAK